MREIVSSTGNGWTEIKALLRVCGLDIFVSVYRVQSRLQDSTDTEVMKTINNLIITE